MSSLMSGTRNRLLVVGGNGFIGRHVVAHAVALGWSVTSLCLSAAPDKFLPSVTYLVADITDAAALNRTLARCSFEYVVNCSGYIDHTPFFQGGREILETHFNGVLNLAELLDRDALKGFVNIGSSDEYGSAPAPQIETQRELPISPYSLGKVASTHFLQMLWRTENFPATTLRLFLTYGPGQGALRFLPQIISGCLKGITFPVSEGAQLRDFCYVDDTIEAIFAALKAPQARGQLFNVGSGQPVSIRDMVDRIRVMIGQGKPEYGRVPYRSGENMALYPDVSKAKTLLGWSPVTSLDVGLANTIQWVRERL